MIYKTIIKKDTKEYVVLHTFDNGDTYVPFTTEIPELTPIELYVAF